MSIDRRNLLALSAAGILAPYAAFAQTAALPPMGIRTGSSTVRGKTIAWRAETGETWDSDETGRKRGTIFSVAYLMEKADPKTRPVAFLWNGGPGAHAVALREQLSPRKTLRMKEAPGYSFVDNPNTIIDVMDLVFIDAPGTGFSRNVDDSSRAFYWGIEEDGRAFVRCIGDWLAAHGRLGSPVYLIGESYGGTRMGQVVRGLARRPKNGVSVQGIHIISGVMGSGSRNMPTTLRENGHYSLPPEAMTAWFHKRGKLAGAPIEKAIAEIEAFAAGPYKAALDKGKALPDDERRAMAEQLASYLAIPTDKVLSDDLFVTTSHFGDLLLADENKTVGGGDTRIARTKRPPNPNLGPPVTGNARFDPVQTESIENLIRQDLHYAAVGFYDRDEGPPNRAWNDKTQEDSDVPTILKAHLDKNPKAKVYLTGGYFDFLVPYPFPLDWLSKKLPSDRFRHKVYPVGHATYGDEDLAPQTTDAFRDFVHWKV